MLCKRVTGAPIYGALLLYGSVPDLWSSYELKDMNKFQCMDDL